MVERGGGVYLVLRVLLEKSGKDFCKSSANSILSLRSFFLKYSASFSSLSFQSRLLMPKRAASQSLLFLKGPRNVSCWTRLPRNISIEIIGPGSYRSSARSAAGLRIMRLPMPLKPLPFNYAVHASICLVTFSFSLQLILFQASQSSIPGVSSVRIHSKPSSLSALEHIAMICGTGIEVSHRIHSSGATSLCVLR